MLRRIEGPDGGSLGLHPAVYFYNERGVYSRHQFLGLVSLITEKVRRNDSDFFKQFSRARAKLEEILKLRKSVLSLAFANVSRKTRVTKFRLLLELLVDNLYPDKGYTLEDALAGIGITGEIIEIKPEPKKHITKSVKAAVYVKHALETTGKCPECHGLLFPERRSVQYDHIERAQDGGIGTVENSQIMHPFCNTVMKEERTKAESRPR